MRLAIGSRIQDGPWGGGNRFAQALGDAACDAGWDVRSDLSGDPDVILLTDPRPRNPGASFTQRDIFRHLLSGATGVVVHRINECDERKGTRWMNARLRIGNYVADHTVFVGSWLKDLAVWRRETPASVILNGADPAVFHPEGFKPWSGHGPLRLVTHHWGANWMKGFDIYSRLDAMLDEAPWRARLAFTYVGNLPPGFTFRNVTHVPPLNGEALANELRRHHGYITASINEPGGNHQNEGAACGLPLLYRRSGCMPEYCEGFGVSFDAADFEARLSEYFDAYPDLVGKMPQWPHVSRRMTGQWLALLSELASKKADMRAARGLWRDPVAAIATQWPV